MLDGEMTESVGELVGGSEAAGRNEKRDGAVTSSLQFTKWDLGRG